MRLRTIGSSLLEAALARAMSAKRLSAPLVGLDRSWLRRRWRSPMAQRFNWHLLAAAQRPGSIRRWPTSLVTGSTLFVDLSDQMWRYIFSYEIWEPATTHFILHWLRPGDLFVDVGANVGYFTVLAAPLVGPGGQVVAFEPQPDLAEMLRYSSEMNGFDECVECVECALSDHGGPATLYFAPNDGSGLRVSGGASLRVQPTCRPEESLAVPTTTLADFLPGDRKARLLKLDVEGAESAVLRGGVPLLQTQPPDAIVCEFQVDRAGGADALASLYELIVGFGYRPHLLGGSDVLMPVAGAPRFGDLRQNLCFVHETAGGAFLHVPNRMCARLGPDLPCFLQ